MLLPALIALFALTGSPTVNESAKAEITEAPTPAATYVRPAVPPFEPRSNFGRTRAQGDAESDQYRRPLTGPVSVADYRHSYEYRPSDSEANYEQGVAQARIDAQGLMGGLDGVWQVTDAEGQVLSALVVADAGRDGDVEAAWSLVKHCDVATTARRDGDDIVIEAGIGARTTRLRLTPTPQGWSGALAHAGQTGSVSLRPSNPG